MTPSYEGVEGQERWEDLGRYENDDDRINVGRNERLISGVAGVALGLYSLRRKRLRGLLLPIAGSLISRAVTGRCAVNRAIGRNSALEDERTSPVASVGRGDGIKVEQAVTINRPREEIFRFWRNFENLPRIMDHLRRFRSWTSSGPTGSPRVPQGPGGVGRRDQRDPGRADQLAPLPGSQVAHAGSVHFLPAQDDATEVRVILRYDPPAGKVGAAVARLFGENPHQVAEDLRRFKRVMEASSSPAPRALSWCSTTASSSAGADEAEARPSCWALPPPGSCASAGPGTPDPRGIHACLTRDGTPPAAFLDVGRAELARYRTVERRAAFVTDAAAVDGGFEVRLEDGTGLASRTLLLATGVVDEIPPLQGAGRRPAGAVRAAHHGTPDPLGGGTPRGGDPSAGTPAGGQGMGDRQQQQRRGAAADLRWGGGHHATRGGSAAVGSGGPSRGVR
jgi:uncharacterized membrane protein